GLLDERLADDADALADLRAAARGELLVEEVLVHTFAFGAAVLLRPRQPEPTALADLAHEGAALRSVDDLRHVLARQIEDVGIIVVVEEANDPGLERAQLGRELEVYGPDCTRRASADAESRAVRR